MTKAQEFLELYNELDDLLRSERGNYDRSRSIILDYCHVLENSNYHNVQERGKVLNQIRVLRNSLIHEFDMNRYELIEISDFAISSLKKEIELLENPTRAIDIAIPINKVISLGFDSFVKDAIKTMVDRGFMHMPVLDAKNHLIGVFSPNAIFMGIGDGIMDKASKEHPLIISDFAKYLPLSAHISEYYVFVPKNMKSEDVLDLFGKYIDKGKKLSVCFVTENGKESESILGLFTSSDIVRL